MIVEILGAKMLSPYIGTSHFVWTAQIAVTLVALACGYYAGGKLSDRSQKLDTLYWAIISAAIYLIVTVPACGPVAYRCLDFNLAIGSLFASAFLFFVPLALLAMTGPFLVRVITSSVTGVGGNVGRLTAIGTFGSFAGTLLVSYVMVPLLANSVSMYLTAGMLLLVGGFYFVMVRRLSAKPLAAVALGLLGIVGLLFQKDAPANGEFREVFRGNSHFGMIQVLDRDDGRMRFYSNDNLIQNTYDPELRQSASTFTYMLSGLARAYTTNIETALCIGMGVGIVPMEFARDGIAVDVVEINPAVVPVAERFFDFDSKKVQLTIDDGRHFLNRATNRYDAVVLDAFLGDSSPSHLMTREAFESIRNVLRPGGVLVINAFCELDRGKDFFAASLNKTLQAVFRGVRMHFGGGQIYFVATDREEPAMVRQIDLTSVHRLVLTDARIAYSTIVSTDPSSGRVLTDDRNPVEFHDAHHREEVRRNLARSARRLGVF
jgi:Spermidine synthase